MTGTNHPTVTESELSELIEQTLTRIHQKQTQLQAIEHTPRRLRQQLAQLRRGIRQAESLLASNDIALEATSQAEYQKDLEAITHFVDQITTDPGDASDITASLNRLNVRNGFELLRWLLDEVQIERRAIAPPSGLGNDTLAIDQELQRLQQSLQPPSSLFREPLDTPLNAAIAKRLNHLAGLLHRIDGLSHCRAVRPNWMQPDLWFNKAGSIAPQLRPLVYQIDRAVDRLDYQTAAAPDLLEETEVFVERQLHRYEYCFGFGWLASRLSDINRFRSPQARVMLGMATTLSLAIVTIATVSGVFTTVSRQLESPVPKSLQLQQKRNTDLQTLQEAVQLLRNQETERQAIQNSIAAQALQNRVAEPEESTSPEPTAAPEPDATNPENAATAPAEPAAGDQAAAPPSTSESTAAAASNAAPGTDATTALPQKERELTSQIQVQRDKVDTLLLEINALTEQINAARTSEANDLNLNQDPDPDTTLKLIANWLNNQQIQNHLSRLALAAFAGALGSMMSIVIRLDKLDEDNLKNPYALGCLKPLIGAVFGVVVFALLSTKVVDVLPAGFDLYEETSSSSTSLQRRDPLGVIDSQEVYKIFVAAFIAGFSERLASDTLKPWADRKGE
ncbi:hypothetical protein [Leptolyngbya iicbica]|uniref:Uncharacterized protein n=2 Tax=Cyanophyceae TaxID=3028117 RepID=A0A4Q7E613_9CYAN|nr:hypothetical protein [Leptolyngbya sp. LK]RZM77410.1 hypothetical protein DYY88_17415 [Leptolyngbya sp. LK]